MYLHWFCDNGIEVNAAKTQMFLLGALNMLRNMSPVELSFCGASMPDNRVVKKKLGITIDRYLSYQLHIYVITKKCTGALKALNQARHVIPKSAMKTIKVSIESHTTSPRILM